MNLNSVLGGVVAAILTCSPVVAAVVVDQSQPVVSGNVAYAASSTGHPLQSFQTSAGNIAGGGFFLTLFSTMGPASIEIGLWDALPNAFGAVQLASDVVSLNLPFGGATDLWVDGFWAPVASVTGATYYLAIEILGTEFAVLGGVPGGNPYAQGELYFRNFQSGGAYLTPGSDTAFRTYTATGAVPEPATWGLMLLGFGAAGALLRRRRAVMDRYSDDAAPTA